MNKRINIIVRAVKARQRPVDPEWHHLARSAGYRASRLARVAGVSLRTLQRYFRAQFGITVSEWLTSIRLAEASDRIRAGGRVKEVALDLGYKQLSHFSREFKRAYGKPPSRLSGELLREN